MREALPVLGVCPMCTPRSSRITWVTGPKNRSLQLTVYHSLQRMAGSPKIRGNMDILRALL